MIRAVLFDMDGVLFDTEMLGYTAMRGIAAEYGYQADLAFYQSTLGVPNAECQRIYLDALGPAFPYEQAMERFRAFFADYVQKQPLPFKPGLMECLAGLRARGLTMALATSTVRPLVDAYFARMPEVAAYLDATVCGGEVPHGKPAPDIYLAAAAALGVPPAQCLGVEDSLAGLRSLRAAGAVSVFIPDLLPGDSRFTPYVDHTLASLAQLGALADKLNTGA